MGFFNFLSVKNNNLAAMPQFGGKSGPIVDGVIHKNRLAFLNGDSRLRFYDENMVLSESVTPATLTRVCSDGRNLYVASNTVVYKSVDDGNSWGAGAGVGVITAMKQLVSGNGLLAVRQASTAGVCRISHDGGMTWQSTVGYDFRSSLSDTKCSTIYIPSWGWIYVGWNLAGNAASIGSSIGGVNWSGTEYGSLGETQGFSAVAFFDNKLYIGAAYTGRVYSMERGGTPQLVESASAEVSNFSEQKSISNFVEFQGELFMVQGVGMGDIGVYKLVNGRFLPVACNLNSYTGGCRVAKALGNRLFISGGPYWYSTLATYGLN